MTASFWAQATSVLWGDLSVAGWPTGIDNNNNNNNNNNQHANAGQLHSFIQLKALLVLHDRGILGPGN
jgi:hypothetical protein